MTKKWTADEDQYLVDNYVSMPVPEISRRLERSIDAIRMRACQLKLHRTKHYWSPEEDAQVLACPRAEIDKVAAETGRSKMSCMLRRAQLLQKAADEKEGRV